MRIATWNVNSIRTRVGRVVDWMVREDVDVLAMQEIKCRDDQFPHDPFTEAGYEVVTHGLNQWNGVAIASRLPMDDIATSFAGMPGFGKANATKTTPVFDPDGNPLEARAIGATVDGVRVWSLYVPNGRGVDDPHYEYKLRWLNALREDTQAWLADESLPLALMGDWNVAPYDSDMGDPSFGPGSTHISGPERDAFHAFEAIGMVDVVRPLVPEGFTFWDYKQLRFPRNEGMRIDFIMGSPAFAELVTDASIHRNERKGDSPSDHVPVLVDLALEGEDEDRPMIFG
jgi:exodeoxyribonuclease-3